MKIVMYRMEMDDDRRNILKQEKEFEYLQADSFDNAGILVEMLNKMFCLDRQSEEYVYMIALNAANRILGIFEISHGTVNTALCNPREILIRALLCGAVNIILAHNHPSGVTKPSNEDIAVYRRIKKAGEAIGIGLLDNIIIGDSYYSFEERGLH